MIEFRLPSLGSDMDRGTLLQWRVEPGQAVKKGDVVAVVDTSKAAVDVEIWVDGTVHRLLTAVGETIPVGAPMALVLAPGEAAPAGVWQPAAAPPTAPGPIIPPTPGAPRVPPRPDQVIATRARVTPAARQRAAELGIAPDALQGTGPDGAVTRDDVERAAQRATPTTGAAPAAASNRAVEMRKAIAAAMARSKREIPHYYLTEPIALRAALDWLRAFNAARPMTERVLPAALLLKAVAVALRAVPELNGHLLDGAFNPVAQANVGVAISLRTGGLVAPALHDVADKPLQQVMQELADLVQRARAGSLRSSEMSDPTITVTNLGEQAVESVHGIIYPPQVALVGFGRITDRPWVADGALAVMPAVTASLAADHRVSDGHRGAVFLARLRDQLQQPQQLEA
ncbi:MAG TPA: dihydrolipoamide acetyltransferase family protein [Burkholderiaceae bacterium]|nr:dihydrolipoamide acetyltransferase family protein [Burkholderiaceae bacterium]